MKNDMTPKPDQLKENILAKIRKDEIRMRPKALFMLKAGVILCLGIAILIVSVWLLSLVLFDIRVSDKLFLLGFGFKGINAFLHLFPWTWLLLDIVLLLTLEYLWKSFRFAYHLPVLYVFAGLLLFSGALGLLINLTTFNNALLDRPQDKRLPVIDRFYEVIRHPQEKREFVRGLIVDIAGPRLLIHSADGDKKLIKVLVAPDMLSAFKKGDKVFVAGDWDGDELRAFGFKKYVFTPLLLRVK